LVGAEIEMARLQSENLQISNKLAAREMMERAKTALHGGPGMEEEDIYVTLQREAPGGRKPVKKLNRQIPRGHSKSPK
jgi:uroporphyrinogen-III synthase